jgi:acetylxylan esterase
VLFGDPSQRNDTSYIHGNWNNTGNGLFYRPDTSACEALGSRIRAYCDAGDPFCDLGPYFNGTAHTKYIQNYGDEVAQFVVDKYRNGATSGKRASATSSATASPTPNNGAVRSRSMSVFPLAGFLLFYLSL